MNGMSPANGRLIWQWLGCHAGWERTVIDEVMLRFTHLGLDDATG